VLVLRGESGIGKTALLEYVCERASGCRIDRCAGVESEMELAFAGLHQLCAPMLDQLERLPGPQRDALQVAFGLCEGGAPDRYLVGVAVLTLLSGVATKRPLVCLIDDAQWLDRVSIQALAFAARRLEIDSVGMVFAVSELNDERELAGLPELMIEGINPDDGRMLLDRAFGRLDERVRDRIVAETRGNPLALLELPRGLTPAELAGGFGLPDASHLACRIEQSFVRRLQSLPRDTQRLLLIAAAEPVGDVTLLWRAAERLGIGGEAALPAQSAGLVQLCARVRFRHPLVRSAVYRAADLSERQDVHRALAEATDPQVDPDRRAWHRAHAAPGPSEVVADELERSAGRASSHGGIAAAAAFLERATELTPDPARRAARALAAAQAKFEAAALDTAGELLETVEFGPLDELQCARSERLRAQIAFARRRGNDAPRLLFRAARRLEPLDAALARETHLESLAAAIFAGCLGTEREALEAAEAASEAPRAQQPARAIDQLLDGLATRFTQGHTAAVPQLQDALGAFRQEEGCREGDSRWLWLACRVAPAVWDDEAWHELATRHVRFVREAGALTALPLAVTYRAGVHVHAGEFAEASVLIEEADTITRATGNAPLMYTELVLSAWRGQQDRTAELVEKSIRDATARGEGRAVTLAEYSTAVLYNGVGRYEAALAAAQRAGENDDLGLFGWSLVELIEAAVRTDQPETAANALRLLEERTRVSGTEWALGIEARSRALLSNGATADSLYREAIDRLARTRIAVHSARAHLLYGEWLRRVKRRVDAREHLQQAHNMFSRFGADGFTERARRELQATGRLVHKPTDHVLQELTSQESQIAWLARDGQTNQEIAAQLFLSPRTVEWHLRKVFTKRGIRSRRQLRDTLRSQVVPTESAARS
jgi:DNA-binding CsgD family transcriptional regulator